jgi:hypothetical protein
MEQLDFDEIQKAFEDTERKAFEYFIDRQTGQLIILSGDIISRAQEILDQSYDDDIGDFDEVEPDEIPEIPEWMEDEIELALEIFMNDQERYIRIPERNPIKTFEAMKEFAESLEDQALKETLRQALDGQGSFRKFKNSLIHYPKERKLWYTFNAKAARAEIKEWLAVSIVSADNDTCANSGDI